MNKPRLFTFWEPEGSIPPYIELCIETWKKNLPEYQVQVVNYSNLFDFVAEDTLDWAMLKRLPLPIQKDAIQAAVLEEQGGVFIDADTIMLGDISHITEKLSAADMVMFGDHFAFIAANAKARIVTMWMEEVRRKLDDLRQNSVWGLLDRVTPKSERITRIFRTAIRVNVKWYFLCLSILPGLKKKSEAGEICQLDRDGHAFILETIHYADVDDQPPQWKYQNFWFNETLDASTAVKMSQSVVGLHHSWSPSWYKRLSKREVLAHGCLLSQTLKRVLES